MCAIAGLINCGDPALLQRMMAAMAHRGPDSRGSEWWPDRDSGLGHCRLAILDLSPRGHQPMTSPDDRYTITFNGEVYNYQELRRELEGKGTRFRSASDTEVVLAAYQAWGAECLNRFNGMFAFAIVDRWSGRLFAARDHLGVKPLYYWHGRDRFVFASEIKGILQCPFVPRSPDYEALFTPARFQVAPRTGFVDILKLPPAHYLVYHSGHLTVRRYWEIVPTEIDEREPDVVDELDDLLRDAVRLQMIADRPVGTFLSGGLDSSLVSALMRQNTGDEIHAFTIKFSDADQQFERMPADSDFARRVARQLGLHYHEMEIDADLADLLPKLVWHLDEPLADPAAINTYLIARAARDLGIVVLLTGMGGDEIFGGYRKHLACLKAGVVDRWTPAALRSWATGVADRLPVASRSRGFRSLRWLKRFAGLLALQGVERDLASDLSLSPAQFEHMFLGRRYRQTWFYRAQESTLTRSDVSHLTRMCLNDTLTFLPEHNLTYSDKAGMAAGIESRPPLTDYRIVERMFTLPPHYRIRGMRQKWLLKEVAERYLPREIVHRPKAPFSAPLRAWIRGPLAGMVDELLSESALKEREFYDARYIRALITRDRLGQEDHGMIIWTLLTTELWFRTFFERRDSTVPGDLLVAT
jgi:asparagine synthase (glutamine-hydrolysing)